MDSAPERVPAVDPAPAQPPIGSDELRSVLWNLSHELCRPLISLKMGFDLLLNDATNSISAEQRGHVFSMVDLCDDLLHLTRSYLDYAGLVQGTRPLSLGTYTVGALVREIGRQFAADASARRIGWRCALVGPDAAVTTDASRCQQIFGNLASNALKYTPAGGEVRVAARVDDRGWSVTVTDDGPGVPEEHRERVFEPFFRMARDDQSRVEGSGLGLAICRELVHQLGGEIELRSEGGTEVAVRFPTHAPAEQPRRR